MKPPKRGAIFMLGASPVDKLLTIEEYDERNKQQPKKKSKPKRKSKKGLK